MYYVGDSYEVQFKHLTFKDTNYCTQYNRHYASTITIDNIIPD